MAEDEGGDGAGDDPVLKSLTAQLAVITKRAEIEEQRKKLLDLGLTTDKLPGGAYTIGGDAPPIEGVILAHQAVTALATQVAERLKKSGVKQVRIRNAADAKLIAGFAAFSVQLEMMEAEANAVVHIGSEAASASILPDVGSVMNAGLQIANLFRADRSITYAKFELNPGALTAALVGALITANAIVSEGADLPETSAVSASIVARLSRLGALRQQMSAAAGAFATGTLEDRTVPPDASQPQTATQPVVPEGSTASASAALARLDAFLEMLTKVDTVSGASPLSEALIAEKLASFLDQPDTHVLACEVQAGGASQTTRWAFKSTLTFSGGAVLTFKLVDRKGVLKDAATLTCYSGFIDADSVRQGDTILRT